MASLKIRRYFENKFKGYFNDPIKAYRDKPVGQDLPEILEYLKLWNNMATTLRLIHLLFGFSGVFFSLLTAAQITKENTYWPHVFAFIAALSIGLMTAFDLSTKSNNARRAWRLLNAAVIRYNQGVDTSKDNVIKAYEEGEKIIGDVSFQNR